MTLSGEPIVICTLLVTVYDSVIGPTAIPEYAVFPSTVACISDVEFSAISNDIVKGWPADVVTEVEVEVVVGKAVGVGDITETPVLGLALVDVAAFRLAQEEIPHITSAMNSMARMARIMIFLLTPGGCSL